MIFLISNFSITKYIGKIAFPTDAYTLLFMRRLGKFNVVGIESKNIMDKWNLIKGQIITHWAEEIDPISQTPYKEYPRPQLRREKWMSLNGLWKYTINKSSIEIPSAFDGQILVPFPLESALSGVKKPLLPKQVLWYKRNFKIPEEWQGKQVLINFGAVDWECEVFLNRRSVGTHKGGYNKFFFDLTPYLMKGENVIHVAVQDPTNKGAQARGKQVLKPWAAFYTAISGIWQSVWLEPVDKIYIEKLRITPLYDEVAVDIEVNISDNNSNYTVIYEVYDDGSMLVSEKGNGTQSKKLKLDPIKPWDPENPHLYDLRISLLCDNAVVDHVESYFGMRKIEVKKNKQNIPKIYLNNKEIFQYGVLDQGYFPDGLYSAPNEDAMRFDIDYTKQIGLNMIRKHVKIEPDIWYHHCDKMGMLVWQDMPYPGSIFRGSLSMVLFKGKKLWVTKELRRNLEMIQQFEAELKDMVENLYNHPCVITWVIFNEGWGQHRTIELTNSVKEWDRTRLINSASGWVDFNSGDIHDIHKYPGPAMPELESYRVAVNGEFGGLGLKVQEHLWFGPKYWAYKTFETREELMKQYAFLVDSVIKLKEKGLVAAIYTQLTDVEQEINGFLTYDREINKFDMDFLKRTNSKLFST